MANTIKHKRGSGSNPGASDLVAGEIAIRTDTGVLFTKKDDNSVVSISGGSTDLGVSTTSSAVTVTSSTGDNATISEASGSAAGVMSTAHHDKLDGIEANATADQSASEILTAIKTVDGASSGLDADLLDGQQGSHYLDYDNFSNTPTIPTNNNQLTNGAGYITATLTNEQVQDIVGGMVSGNSESGISVTYQDGDGTLDFSVSSQTDNNFTTTLKNKLDGIAAGAEVNVATNLSKTTTTTTNVIASSTGTNVTLNEATGSAAGLMSTTHHNKLDGIESGATADQSASEILTLIKTVDGSGSGLDADTLDGISSASFLRSDTSDTVSGHTEWQDAKEVRLGNSADMQLYHTGGVNYIDVAQDLLIRHAGETMIRCNDDSDVELYYDNSKKLETTSAGISITGNVAVSGGIDFSADSNAGGATTEVLDDYERGTWTPVYRGSSTAGSYSPATAAGVYVKVGNVVYASASVLNIGGSGGSGDLQISGFPFANDAGQASLGHVFLDDFNMTNTAIYLVAIMGSTDTHVTIREVKDTAADTTMSVTDLDGSNSDLVVTITYIAA